MRVCTRHMLAILLLLGTPEITRSQTPASEALSLEQCIAIALEKNPLVLSAAHHHEASLARIRQATAFPHPSLDFVSDFQPRFLNFIDAPETHFGFSQTLEFPGKRSVRGKIAERGSKEAETDIEVIKLDLAFEVKKAFYQLLLAQEMLRYARSDLELSEDYLKKAEEKLGAGDVAKVEVIRARVEALKAANAVRVATNDERVAKARLNFLLARRSTAPVEIRGQLELPFVGLDLERLKDEALALRPEIKKLQYSIEREQWNQQSSKLSNYPDLDFSLSKARVVGEPSSWAFTVSAPLPFLFQKRQKAEIAESRANVAALRRDIEQNKNSILLEVEEAFMNAETAKNQILVHRQEILPQAEEVHSMFLFSYREGAIGGIEIIEARRTLNESRKLYADALFEYALATAGLERAVGRRP